MCTIRRTNKFWCGTSPDMVIEQTLMKAVKSKGGLVHGRGMSDSVTSKWVITTPAIGDICDCTEKFAGVSFATSKQNVDCRDARIERDTTDVTKLLEWFSSHSPFPVTDRLMSISTGIIGDERVNCHKAYNIGVEVMRSDWSDVFRSKSSSEVYDEVAECNAVRYQG